MGQVGSPQIAVADSLTCCTVEPRCATLRSLLALLPQHAQVPCLQAGPGPGSEDQQPVQQSRAHSQELHALRSRVAELEQQLAATAEDNEELVQEKERLQGRAVSDDMTGCPCVASAHFVVLCAGGLRVQELPLHTLLCFARQGRGRTHTWGMR